MLLLEFHIEPSFLLFIHRHSDVVKKLRSERHNRLRDENSKKVRARDKDIKQQAPLNKSQSYKSSKKNSGEDIFREVSEGESFHADDEPSTDCDDEDNVEHDYDNLKRSNTRRGIVFDNEILHGTDMELQSLQSIQRRNRYNKRDTAEMKKNTDRVSKGVVVVHNKQEGIDNGYKLSKEDKQKGILFKRKGVVVYYGPVSA